MSQQEPTAPSAIDVLAQRVVELLMPRIAEMVREELHRDQALVGPDEIARRLARSVEWVRDFADELGVIRMGEGPKSRLWFRPDVVDERLRSLAATPKHNGKPQPRPHKRPGHTPSGAEMLDVKSNNNTRSKR